MRTFSLECLQSTATELSQAAADTQRFRSRSGRADRWPGGGGRERGARVHRLSLTTFAPRSVLTPNSLRSMPLPSFGFAKTSHSLHKAPKPDDPAVPSCKTPDSYKPYVLHHCHPCTKAPGSRREVLARRAGAIAAGLPRFRV